MVLLNSEKKPLQTPMPDFELQSVDGKKVRSDSFKNSKVLVIMFICNHCPYVKAIEDRILSLKKFFEKDSVQFVGICSNDSTNYPDDSPQSLLKRWTDKKYGFPYLIDESQETARKFGAVCTPDIYVYDANRKLSYHGRLDDNWQEPSKVTQEDLKLAIQALLAGKLPASDQIPSMGCSIKWKSA